MMSKLIKKLKTFNQLIMIEQTLFSLPFAYLGVLFAGETSWQIWLWTTLALFGARTAGMSFNRAIDADIDAKNPRTAERLIPAGKVSLTACWGIAILNSLLLVFASSMLNELCFYLSFVAVFLLFTYSFFKRFSSSAHFYLGVVEAAAPIGGYLAVTGKFTLDPFILGLAIMMWIAGLDMLYALQDEKHDRAEGLHSVPAKVGRKKTMIISIFCYLLSIAALIFAGYRANMGIVFYISTSLIALIMIAQEVIAAQAEDVLVSLKRVFSLNKFISPILFVGTFIDIFFMK